MKNTVTVVGTGLMGTAIAEILLQKNFTVYVYNRTKNKLDCLKEKNAIITNSVEEAVAAAPIIISALFDMASINEVLIQPGKQKLELIESGLPLID